MHTLTLITVHTNSGVLNRCFVFVVFEQVTGEANETQICEALRRYSEREGFVREALFHLFSLTHVMEKPRPDILKVIISTVIILCIMHYHIFI